VLSSYGASLRQIRLKDRQFLKNAADPSSGMQVVSTSGENTAPLRIAFAKADFRWDDHVVWTVQPSECAASVVFRAETDEVVVEKRYSLENARYRLLLSVFVQNKTARESRP
jgi:hypothetical protein